MLFTFYVPFCIRYFIPTSVLYAASTQSRDETKNNGVSGMCDNDIVLVGSCTVVYVQGVQQTTLNAALWGTSAE